MTALCSLSRAEPVEVGQEEEMAKQKNENSLLEIHEIRERSFKELKRCNC